jgi:TetR/AcrR family transcriptional regulator
MLDDDERVDAILDAAYVCFTRHGVRRTTMDDLARQAGMSRPAVYQYVRNKEDAFQRLVRRLLEETLAASRTAMQSERGLARRLAAALEAKLALVMRVWRDSPAHAAELLSIDARTSADLLADYDEAMHQLLADALLKAHPGADAKAVAEILLALTRGLEADLTTPGEPVRRLRQGVALIVAGLDTVKESS